MLMLRDRDCVVNVVNELKWVPQIMDPVDAGLMVAFFCASTSLALRAALDD